MGEHGALVGVEADHTLLQVGQRGDKLALVSTRATRAQRRLYAQEEEVCITSLCAASKADNWLL